MLVGDVRGCAYIWLAPHQSEALSPGFGVGQLGLECSILIAPEAHVMGGFTDLRSVMGEKAVPLSWVGQGHGAQSIEGDQFLCLMTSLSQ